MPDETVTIPLNDPAASLRVRVIALHKGKDAGLFAYLQGVRSGILKAVNADPEETEAAKAYHRNEKRYFEMLANAVVTDADAVISPPSRMPWQAEPYRLAILSKNLVATDLTPRLTRTGNTFTGEDATTVGAVAAGLNYAPTGQESKIRRLVIVDDTFTTGTTAAATVEVLRSHGLPAGCEIIVACPLRLDTVAALCGSSG